MTIVLEDGSVVNNANSYVTVEEADNYFTLRNNSEWLSLENAQKVALIVSAVDYIELRYSRRFIGAAKSPGQALSWPRVNTGLHEVIPTALKKAVFEYAIIAKNGPLAPNPKYDESGVPLITRREKVGPLETEYRHPSLLDGYQMTDWRSYPFADGLIEPLLRYEYVNRVIRN